MDNRANTAIDAAPCCLAVGGSDSCGGAGIQADLRVFARLGVRGCSAITALTAQNPARVTRVESAPLAQFDAELHAISDHYAIAAVKTGMLTSAEHIGVLLAWLDLHAPDAALVVDPVAVASSGRALLDEAGFEVLRHQLAPRATLLTPNLDEAARLLGRSPDAAERDAGELARELLDALAGDSAVLVKGGHAEPAEKGEMVCDVLALPDGRLRRFEHPRKPLDAERLHGTGCRLAAAAAARLALGDAIEQAVEHAIEFLQDDLLPSKE